MRKYVAEFIGTFVLTFIACGAASFTGGYQGLLGILGIALIFGLCVTAMAYSIGNISGCHINPAVSLAMFMSGKMETIDFLGYIIAQMAGGIAAGFALLGLSKSFDAEILTQYETYGYDLVNLGVNSYGDGAGLLSINVWGALLVEIILTFIFIITVLGVTSKEKYSSVAGVVIGLSLTLVHLFGIPFTGTGVNPARSFGPALAAFADGNAVPMTQVWLFVAGPLIGAILAAGVYTFLTTTKKEAEAKEEAELEKVIEDAIKEYEEENENDDEAEG